MELEIKNRVALDINCCSTFKADAQAAQLGKIVLRRQPSASKSQDGDKHIA